MQISPGKHSATTVSSMAHTMKAMQKEIADMQAERVYNSWQHIQDMSMQGDMNINTVNKIKPFHVVLLVRTNKSL